MPKTHKVRFDFWLRVDRPEEGELADTIAELKQARKFHAVVRDGIKILSELLQGNVEPLVKQFPWVYDAIVADYLHHNAPDTPKSDDSGDSGSNTDKTADAIAQRVMERVEGILMQQGSVPVVDGQKPSKALPPPAQSDDDIMESITTRRATDINSGANLLQQLTELQDGIQKERAKRTGSKKPAKSKGKPVTIHVTEVPADDNRERTEGGLLKMQGADVAFAAPEFDDLELTI